MALGSGLAVGETAEIGERNGGYVPVCFFISFFFFCPSFILESWRLETNGMLVRSPANSSHIAIKRVVGLPGDRITTREPCMKPTQIVPFNHVWLEGDAEDPHRSLDSNTYGPVSISLITGRVVAVLGPRMRWLNWMDWEADKVADAGNGSRLGDGYRQCVRDRVLKEAVRLEHPTLD